MRRKVSPACAARGQPKDVLWSFMLQVNRKAACSKDAGMIDTFEVKSFLNKAEGAALRAELRQAAGSQATVLSGDPGGEVKPLVRRSSRRSACRVRASAARAAPG